MAALACSTPINPETGKSHLVMRNITNVYCDYGSRVRSIECDGNILKVETGWRQCHSVPFSSTQGAISAKEALQRVYQARAYRFPECKQEERVEVKLFGATISLGKISNIAYIAISKGDPCEVVVLTGPRDSPTRLAMMCKDTISARSAFVIFSVIKDAWFANDTIRITRDLLARIGNSGFEIDITTEEEEGVCGVVAESLVVR